MPQTSMHARALLKAHRCHVFRLAADLLFKAQVHSMIASATHKTASGFLLCCCCRSSLQETVAFFFIYFVYFGDPPKQCFPCTTSAGLLPRP